jgi:hypothetical protein
VLLQVPRAVSVDVQQLLTGLDVEGHPQELSAHLSLLGALFSTGFQSPVVSVGPVKLTAVRAGIGRQEYRRLFIYLQQFIIKV